MLRKLVKLLMFAFMWNVSLASLGRSIQFFTGKLQNAKGRLLRGAKSRQTRPWCPPKRFKDQLKWQLTQAGIDHSEWEELAEDREEWRGTIKTAADNSKEGRKTAAAEKRQGRKDSASQPVTDTTFTYPS